MKPQDWFGIGARFVGLWWAVESFRNVLYYLNVKLGFLDLTDSTPFDDNDPTAYLLYALGYGLLAPTL